MSDGKSTKKRPTYTAEQKAAMVAEYVAGRSLNEIAARWQCCAATPWQAVRRAGVTMRPTGGQSLPIRENAFDYPESDPDAAYFAGLIFADGCVFRKRRSSLVLSLGGPDGHLIYQFRDWLESSHKVRVEKPDSQWATESSIRTTISITSARLVDALERCGITPRKSLTAVPPPFLVSNRDWWRGVVDGDGWVGISPAPNLGVTGTLETCEAFAAYARSITETRPTPHRNGSIWMLRIATCNAYRVANTLYQGCRFALNRKREMAERIAALAISRGWKLTGRTPTGPKPRPR